MKNFQSLNLSTNILNALERMSFTIPTPIQNEAIPIALQGKDILGSAQTGTGKTGAFAIPLVAKMLESNHASALVLVPTRELATQVMDTIRKLIGSQNQNIRSIIIIGGEAIQNQLNQLRTKARTIVVGTPGRVYDHIKRNSLKLEKTSFLVLDEIDTMLDMGFRIQLDKIIEHLPAQRQTLMFSATLPQNIVGLAERYLTAPVRIAVAPTKSTLPKIKQQTIKVSESEKYEQLLVQIDQRQGSIMIFVNTKHSAEKLTEKLHLSNQSVNLMHGDLRQAKREKVLKDFRNSKHRIMVATNVAARGIDVPHIEHVINYDVPQCSDDYVHRIGRTARAGAEGSVVDLITGADRAKWQVICQRLYPDQVEKSDHKQSLRRNVGSIDPNYSKDKIRKFRKPNPYANTNNTNTSGYSPQSKNNNRSSKPTFLNTERRFKEKKFNSFFK